MNVNQTKQEVVVVVVVVVGGIPVSGRKSQRVCRDVIDFVELHTYIHHRQVDVDEYICSGRKWS